MSNWSDPQDVRPPSPKEMAREARAYQAFMKAFQAQPHMGPLREFLAMSRSLPLPDRLAREASIWAVHAGLTATGETWGRWSVADE